MVVFLVAPLAVERFRVPGMVGVIIAGALLGPHGLNVLERGQTIVLLEQGRYGPSLALAFRIARVFGLEVDEVFRYEGE